MKNLKPENVKIRSIEKTFPNYQEKKHSKTVNKITFKNYQAKKNI